MSSSPLAVSASGSSPNATSDVANTPANAAVGSAPLASSPVTPFLTGGLGTPSAASGGISPLGASSTRSSQRTRLSPNNSDQPSGGRAPAATSSDDDSADGPAAKIWGTTVDSRMFIRASKAFFMEFRDDGQDANSLPYYLQVWMCPKMQISNTTS